MVVVNVPDHKFKNVKVNLCPNPAPGYFYLNLTACPQEPVQVEILSITGQVLVRKNLVGGFNTKVDIGSLSAGKYLVRVSANTFSQTLPLTKE